MSSQATEPVQHDAAQHPDAPKSARPRPRTMASMLPGRITLDPALEAQLAYFRTVIAERFRDQGIQDYWTEVWEAAVKGAAAKIAQHRVWFYFLQGAATTAAVVVPALVGLKLSGTGGGA